MFAVFMLTTVFAGGCANDSSGTRESNSDDAAGDGDSSEADSGASQTGTGSANAETANAETADAETTDAETADAETADAEPSDETETDTSEDSDGVKFDLGPPLDAAPTPELPSPALWYSTQDYLFYIGIDPADGTATTPVQHDIVADDVLPLFGGGLAILEGGGLLLVRGPGSVGGYYDADSTSVFYAEGDSLPTTVPGVAYFEFLGKLPDNTAVEGLHVDCEGKVYLMDSGIHSASIIGNRLLRFTGDYLAGDLSYEVITDLGMADVPDIDDMSPGIDIMGELTDSQGFGLDSGRLYDFNYLDGTGVLLGMAGTYGVHVLGGPFFDDDVARLYVMDSSAALFEIDPVTLQSSGALVVGPDVMAQINPGLAGPLSLCDTSFPQG
ncbi:hypothetical protein G6O69_23435 [Pseudenhygromyxa sp. WMMC2535]|uniref:hypothetical protein n=1 Tax=Pseudenhygromyxa sp. WMMC2535 TaxID=2712867 RepID=UPI001552ED03|nr:hypothetical protein [Pseudenhygromyxa sp. WMMC2535]NVB40812.1 hypothetical protein [Pseudenhygromyxa sp. WMMC2535]